MNDHEKYASGLMNADEREQWDHVTVMMAEAGEYDGYVRPDPVDTGDDDDGAGD